MNIGARIGCWSGGWKNPYVTDGLVAMFDAEWNAGGGKHSNAQSLKDLVSGNDIQLDKCTVYANYMDINTQSNFSSWKIPYAVGDAFTVEVAGVAVTLTGPVTQMIGGLYNVVTNSFGAKDGSLVGDCVVSTYDGSSMVRSWALYNGKHTGFRSISCSATFGSTIRYMMFNGKDLETGSDKWDSQWSETENTGKIRIPGYTGGKYLFHCMRIYQGHLTTADRLKNYEIDQLRFNT